MIEARNLTRVYRPKKGTPVKALDGVNLKIEEKGMVFILGKSGSGKSTLLNVLGGLDRYDEGEVIIKGKSSKHFKQSEFDSYRNTYLGFIFQEYNILNEFTVGANIALAMELQGKKATPEALNALLETVDLTGYANRKPNELSGGQKQRVAIARALIKDPEIIMADEPTGALDSNTGKQVFDTLKKLSKEKLVIIVSHDREFAEYYGDRVIELADGKIISDISKYKAEANKENEAVSVIDDKILHVKKGYQLTQKDLQLINAYIAKNNSDTIISLDEKSNTDFKKFARIDDEGNRDSFKNTRDEELKLNNYDEKSFKLIKSKLPLKNAVKIGASSLKAKPIKLFFTILLSAIAFCLFGLADTVSAYNKEATAYRSMLDTGINYVSFNKKDVHKDGDYSWATNTNMDDSDLTFLTNNLGTKVVPVVCESNGYSSGYPINSFVTPSELQGNSYTNYYTRNIIGFSEFENAEDLNKFGYSLDGTFPKDSTEIVISEYIYEQFKLAGWSNPIVTIPSTPTTSTTTPESNVTSHADLIGKKIIVGSNTFTVSGILNLNMDTERYASLLPSDTPATNNTGLDAYMLSSEVSSNICYGPYAVAFVKKGFVEDKLDLSFCKQLSSNNTNFSGKSYSVSFGYYNTEMNVDPSYVNPTQNSQFSYFGSYFSILDNVSSFKKRTFKKFDGSALTELNSNECVVSYNMLTSLYEGDKGLYCPSKQDFASSVYANANNYVYELYDNNEGEKLASFIADQKALDSNFNDSDRWYVADAFSMYYQNAYYNFFNSANSYVKYCEKTIEDFYLNDYEIAMNEYYQTLRTATFKNVIVNVADWETQSYKDTAFRVVGFYESDKNNGEKELFISQDGYNSLEVELSSSKPYQTVLAPMTDESTLTKLINFNYEEHNINGKPVMFTLQNSVMNTLSQVNGIISTLSQAFFYVGIAFAVFASFLMMNFISTSISYKKREIGILRAVGARSNDVFSIFFSESFIIACINWLISTIFTFIIIYYINFTLKSQFAIQLTILIVGIRQILLIFAVSALVAFLASIIPVSSIARKRPIDAIHNK